MRADAGDFILRVSLDLFRFLAFGLILSFNLYLQLLCHRALGAMALCTLCVLCSDPLPTDCRFMAADCTHAYHLVKEMLWSRGKHI